MSTRAPTPVTTKASSQAKVSTRKDRFTPSCGIQGMNCVTAPPAVTVVVWVKVKAKAPAGRAAMR